MKINKTSKNEELLQVPEIAAALKEGKVVIVDVAETKNPEFVSLFLAQQVKGLGGGSLNSAQTLLLGFSDSTQIIRCVQNADAKQAETLVPGNNLNDAFKADFALQVEDSLVANPEFDHKPRMGTNRDTKELETLVCRTTGKPVYRQATLVPADEVEHKTIRTVLESQYADKPVAKEKIIAQV